MMTISDLPQAFVERINTDYPKKASEILQGYLKPVSTTIQHNALNGQSPNPIPGNPYGELLSERPNFALDPRWHAGAYYVQEAHSQMVYKATLKALEFVAHPFAIDLCAAPGGKSLSVLNALQERGVLWSNELIPNRHQVLRENLVKWGHRNTISSQGEVDRLLPLGSIFDLVLVDAPCSGEGMFRKEEKAITGWHKELPYQCAVRQEKILDSAVQLVADEGYLLYSTCTLAPEENELQMKRLEASGWKEVDWGASGLEGAIQQERGTLFTPGRPIGEGFYICLMQKKGGDITPLSSRKQKLSIGKKKLEEIQRQIDFLDVKDQSLVQGDKGLKLITETSEQLLHHAIENRVKVSGYGINVAINKGRNWVPHADLAFAKGVSFTASTIELTEEEALDYLRLASLGKKHQGWALVVFEGANLGWVKGVGNRLNNYFPKGWRLRS